MSGPVLRHLAQLCVTAAHLAGYQNHHRVTSVVMTTEYTHALGRPCRHCHRSKPHTVQYRDGKWAACHG
jgi:hypothetical protein